MTWLHIVGAAVCWIVALGMLALFFMALDEAWHRGRISGRYVEEAVSAVLFGAVAVVLIWSGIAVLPSQENLSAAMNAPLPCLTCQLMDSSPDASPCASLPLN